MLSPISDYPEAIRKYFRQVFEQDPLVIRSPGRINLIGEHTDYNNGYVLPAAINKSIFLGIHRRNDSEIHLYSLDYKDKHQTATDKIEKSGKLWPDYILGVIEQIQDSYPSLGGFNIVFGGDIPPGAGLSSSAALECATAYALNKVLDLGFEEMELVLLSQAAENQFVGVQCGVMDQFVSVFGKKNSLIKLDCGSLKHSYIPFKADDAKIILFDTQVKHSLASSAYNERRVQCEEGLKLIQAKYPDVSSLRLATEEMLAECVQPENELAYKRCSYVLAENERVLDACDHLHRNNVDAFGKLMFETHEGLKTLYEVSCNELDVLVDLVKDDENVFGARMMGGGFGGCTINLVKSAAANELINNVLDAYEHRFGKQPLVYQVSIENGTGVVE
jgi:galactokinase